MTTWYSNEFYWRDWVKRITSSLIYTKCDKFAYLSCIYSTDVIIQIFVSIFSQTNSKNNLLMRQTFTFYCWCKWTSVYLYRHLIESSHMCLVNPTSPKQQGWSIVQWYNTVALIRNFQNLLYDFFVQNICIHLPVL